MKTMVAMTMDHGYAMGVKAACRDHGVSFSEYAAAAIDAFISPQEYAARKNEEINDRLRRKVSTSLPHEADKTAE